MLNFRRYIQKKISLRFRPILNFCQKNSNKLYIPGNKKISQFLKDAGLNVREKASGGFVTETCPLCPKHHNNDRSNHWTLNFKDNEGLYFCFRCGSSGTWSNFYRLIVGENISKENITNQGVERGFSRGNNRDDFGFSSGGRSDHESNSIRKDNYGDYVRRSLDEFEVREEIDHDNSMMENLNHSSYHKRSHFESNSFAGFKSNFIINIFYIKNSDKNI